MARRNRTCIRRRRGCPGVLLLSIAVSAVLGACGESTPESGGPGLLAHVLTRDGSLKTYSVDAETGSLSPLGTQSVPQAQEIAIDPSGRVVFAVRWNGRPSWGLTPWVHELSGQPSVAGRVRSYRVQHATGALTFVGESETGLSESKGPGSIAAGAGFVYTVWGAVGGSSGSHVFYDLVRFQFTPEGVLSRAASQSWGLNHDSGPWLVSDSQRGLFYGRRGDYRVGAFVADADGTLQVASEAPVPDSGAPGCPLDDLRQFSSVVAADGLFYVATDSGVTTPCGGVFYPFSVDSATRALSAGVPHAAAGDASVLAFLPPANGSAGLLAVGGAGIQVYSIGASGELTPLGSAPPEIAAGRASSLTFHPSGRFLYATYPTGLLTLEVTADPTLHVVNVDPGISGSAFEPAGHLLIAPTPPD
jgi:hypothetical protein